MNGTASPQGGLYELTARFARAEILPRQNLWERSGSVPRELHQRAAALARASLIRNGTPDQINRFVRPVLAGEQTCALGVTEASRGSDVRRSQRRAAPAGDGWSSAGSKASISSGHRADFVTLAARTIDDRGNEGISLFVVESDRSGFEVGRKLEKMGWLSSDMADLHLSGVRRASRQSGRGAEHRDLTPDRAVPVRASSAREQCAALGHLALELATDWIRTREAFGGPLATRQVIAHRIAEMWERLQAADALIRSCTGGLVSGRDIGADAAAAKNVAVAASEWVAYQATQLFGWMAYMRACEVERIYRDVRLYGIGGGTTEIMRQIMARELL